MAGQHVPNAACSHAKWCSCRFALCLQVERVTRESNFYPPERVKTFLMEVRRRWHAVWMHCGDYV